MVYTFSSLLLAFSAVSIVAGSADVKASNIYHGNSIRTVTATQILYSCTTVAPKYSGYIRPHPQPTRIPGTPTNLNPGQTGSPVSPHQPEKPQKPEIPQKPTSPQQSETPQKPEIPQKPTSPQQPETPQKPEIPQKPISPQKPEIPQKPISPQQPEIPQKPVSPQQPEIPQKPTSPLQPETPQSPSKPAGDHEVDKRTLEMLCRVNKLRAQVGKKLLKIDTRLMSSAQKHSDDQALNKKMSHVGTVIASFAKRIKAAGYAWTNASENVAGGQKTIEEVMNSWHNSSGHYNNIIGDFECFGWGEKDSYWTQNFGKGPACTQQVLPNCPSY